MQKELFRQCRKFENHRFNAAEAFKEIYICPFCGSTMDLVELVTDNKGKVRYYGDTMGSNRSLKIDSLSRLPWFSDAIDINEIEQERSRELWTLDDALELAGLFHEIGIADQKTWKKAAESIGRSLYAVERQLRMVVNCEHELEDYYPR